MIVMERLDRLFDAAGNLLAVSEKNEERFSKSIELLDLRIQHINDVEKNTKRAIERSSRTASEQIVEQVSESLLNKLNMAHIEAEQAALRYEKSSRYSVLKLSFIMLVLLVGVSASIWLLFIKNIPTIEEIRSLRVQGIELQRKVDKLEQYGDISECDGQICVSVDVEKHYTSRDGTVNYYVIAPK